MLFQSGLHKWMLEIHLFIFIWWVLGESGLPWELAHLWPHAEVHRSHLPQPLCISLNFPVEVVFFFLIYLFIYFWLCWVFVSVRGLSLVAASRGHSSSRCAGLSLSWPLLLRGTGSRCASSVVMAHGPSSSAAHGIFPDQGSNPCPLHWQADSQTLRHQGSPEVGFTRVTSTHFIYTNITKLV